MSKTFIISNKLCAIAAIFMLFVNMMLLQKYIMLYSIMYETNTLNSHEYKFDGVDDAKFLINMNNFEYMISKPKCVIRVDNSNNTVPYFVTLIHTAPVHISHRNAIRDTWGHSDPRTLTYFLMGKVESPSLQEQIAEEDAKHNDIIQGNFIDTYHNLTYKHVMVLKWFTYNCPQVKYLVKMDDDVYLNVPAVYEFLKGNKHDRNFLMGTYKPPEFPERNGKWKVTRDQLINDYNPEYIWGPVIFYSNDFAIKAYKKSQTSRFHWVDDVFVTGMIRMQLNAKITPFDEQKHYLRNKNLLDILVNPFVSSIPDFMFSFHNRIPINHRTIWNKTESYRLKHKWY